MKVDGFLEQEKTHDLIEFPFWKRTLNHFNLRKGSCRGRLWEERKKERRTKKQKRQAEKKKNKKSITLSTPNEWVFNGGDPRQIVKESLPRDLLTDNELGILGSPCLLFLFLLNRYWGPWAKFTLLPEPQQPKKAAAVYRPCSRSGSRVEVEVGRTGFWCIWSRFPFSFLFFDPDNAEGNPCSPGWLWLPSFHC